MRTVALFICAFALFTIAGAISRLSDKADETGVYRFEDEEKGIVCYYRRTGALHCLYDMTNEAPATVPRATNTEEMYL